MKKGSSKSFQKLKKPQTSGVSYGYVIAGALSVIALCLFIYLPGLSNGFVYDDVAYVTENALFSLKGKELWEAVFQRPVHGNYHPLTVATLVWDFQSSQFQPERYHLTNLFLHMGNSLLAGLLAYRLFSSMPVGIVSALLFAVHPLHVESVAWISERKDVLYAFFFFLAWIFMDLYKQQKNLIFYLLAFVFFLASCLSKGMAVVLPPLILAGWYFQSGILNKNLKQMSREYLLPEMSLFFVTALIFGIVALRVQSSFGFIVEIKYSFLDKFLYVCYGLVFYPLKTLLPLQLSALYPYPMGIYNQASWEHYASVPGLLVLVFLFYYFRKDRRVIFAGMFYIIAISIVLQVIPVGGAITADRYAYIAHTGFLFLMAALWVQAHKKFEVPAYILLVLALAGYTWQAKERVKVWESNKTLFMDVAEKFPRDPLAFYNTANALEKEGNPREALNWYAGALKNMPDYIDALYNTGSIYGRDLSNPDSGIYFLKKAVTYDPKRADAWNNLGVFHFNRQEFRPAVGFYQQSIKLRPEYMEAWFNLGNAYVNLSIFDSAKYAFEKSVAINPSFASGYISLGNIYANTGNTSAQINAYQQAARLGHNEAQTWLKRNNINW